MLITITKAELNAMIHNTYNIDTTNTPIDIEGYTRNTSNPRFTISNERPFESPAIDTKVTVNNNNQVLKIDHIDKRKAYMGENFKHHVDRTAYNTLVLDFATSNKDKQLLSLEGLTLACIKERYKRAIVDTKTEDMVKFQSIKSTPYLVRRATDD
jgi:hypothetical protein